MTMKFDKGLRNMLGKFPPEAYEDCRVSLRNGDSALIIRPIYNSDRGKVFDFYDSREAYGFYGEYNAPDGSVYMLEWDVDGVHAPRVLGNARVQPDSDLDIVGVHLYPFEMQGMPFHLKSIPEWAEYIAVDGEGWVHAYEVQPRALMMNDSAWIVEDATRSIVLMNLHARCLGWKYMCAKIEDQPWAKEFVK